MKTGTLYIQNRKKAAQVKGGAMAALLLALWACTLLPWRELALVVLALGLAAALWITRTARKQGWFYLEAAWTLTDETLTVGSVTIPREKILRTTCHPINGLKRKDLHCWLLQVEIREDVYQWYSRTQSDDDQKSIQSLRDLADELGVLGPGFKMF